ncbi:MAG: HAMP domain-containing histidine kinase [Oscillospiraceae bacterium]|nr:HAMP domain-containing histidine kinase [Oscillospiraceae bacterium]
MMLFRNPEIKNELIIESVIVALFSALCFYLNVMAGFVALVMGASVIIVHIVFHKRRYRKLTSLCDDIDKVLNGDDTVSFSCCEEGEISILRSEIHKMTKRIREQNSALTAEREHLKDVMADISHQLKTPLTSMSLILTVLRTKELSDKERITNLRKLSDILSKTEWLIETLLKMSSFDAGAVEIHKEEIPCRSLINNAVSSLEIMAELRGVELITQANADTVCADLNWTTEALRNIIKNCIEHTPSGGHISITAEETPVAVTIKITDNGIGISEKDLPHIFKRFYKADNVLHQGYGIGLAFSRQIITAQGGIIKAKNAKPHGSEFSLVFYKATV